MIYDTIKKICKERGLSVSFVEKKAGLGNGTIGRWNNSSPTTESIQAVAKVLGVPIETLLEE